MAFALDLIAAWPGARWLQQSGVAYLFVNAAHILGLALLVGAVFTLDFLILGRMGDAALLPALAARLSRTAGCGLVLALVTGVWLFSVRPHDYLGNIAFLCKLALLLIALTNVVWQHRSAGWVRMVAGHGIAPAVRVRALFSLLLWCAVLLAGRWIGFL
ncbi:DUF6644 family protein [Diaphorobacter aerolatus]|uniref:DUF2214 domain-containing protein n=1 Tax=Diaphorobacter aerolatus TaxID=1288495 RepID=A0A7H0GPV3_9BURK|nr:DUF6644 family protein [Diaphorobacter aerolatus]QNP50319.1 DUF2214 domain-containing protein [Diaphorobacter aerolatus]